MHAEQQIFDLRPGHYGGYMKYMVVLLTVLLSSTLLYSQQVPKKTKLKRRFFHRLSHLCMVILKARMSKELLLYKMQQRVSLQDRT
jgi:hypothetical protein